MPMAFSKKTEQRDLFRGALEMMVLRSVLREPMHGYALVQHIKQRFNELLQVEEGSLYPALQRLLREGLLDAKWEISASNRGYALIGSRLRAGNTWIAKTSASSGCSRHHAGSFAERILIG